MSNREFPPIFVYVAATGEGTKVGVSVAPERRVIGLRNYDGYTNVRIVRSWYRPRDAEEAEMCERCDEYVSRVVGFPSKKRMAEDRATLKEGRAWGTWRRSRTNINQSLHCVLHCGSGSMQNGIRVGSLAFDGGTENGAWKNAAHTGSTTFHNRSQEHRSNMNDAVGAHT